jgi:hypothetical protein
MGCFGRARGCRRRFFKNFLPSIRVRRRLAGGRMRPPTGAFARTGPAGRTRRPDPQAGPAPQPLRRRVIRPSAPSPTGISGAATDSGTAVVVNVTSKTIAHLPRPRELSISIRKLSLTSPAANARVVEVGAAPIPTIAAWVRVGPPVVRKLNPNGERTPPASLESS